VVESSRLPTAGYASDIETGEFELIELGLQWSYRDLATLGDGSETVFDVYNAAIVWNSYDRNVIKSQIESIEFEYLSKIAINLIIITFTNPKDLNLS
jgi:hypothetical protein